MATLANYSETDLLVAWLKKVRERGDRALTRSDRVETRHVCYYASVQLQELRNQQLNDSMTSAHTVAELREVISDLEGLVAYLTTGKGGGFSHLHDRNR